MRTGTTRTGSEDGKAVCKLNARILRLSGVEFNSNRQDHAWKMSPISNDTEARLISVGIKVKP